VSWKYFSDSEVEGLNHEFVQRLEDARELAGVPFVITSGLRLLEANESASGVQDSAHLSGMAVDLKCSTSSERFKMLKALLMVGINRLGVYDRHIHADVDSTKDQSVIWVGLSH
jgi:uncharacterized protein YcbK (DUF882 family)